MDVAFAQPGIGDALELAVALHLFHGAVAGIAVDISLYPLDTLKVRSLSSS